MMTNNKKTQQPTNKPAGETKNDPSSEFIQNKVISWFEENARELPWRIPDVLEQENPAWAIMVSEIMLQQTPVVRVLPQWINWLETWPTPQKLAQAPTADVLRAWQRLGYPRRALRLQEAAYVIASEFSDIVPDNYAQLSQLPGIGDYTAAAIASIAYDKPEVVVDTNVRRVEARAFSGKALPSPSYNKAEKILATQAMPHDPDAAVQWNAAVMELGALVCTAKNPKCDICPIFNECAWIKNGKPEPKYQPRGQKWHGTNRQIRGAIMQILRNSSSPVEISSLAHKKHIGSDDSMIEKAIEGLLKDGLAISPHEGFLELP